MPESSNTSDAAARVQAALDLFETGVDLMRQNLRRRHPDETREEIERKLGDWLADRPGAKYGDSAGRVVNLETRRT